MESSLSTYVYYFERSYGVTAVDVVLVHRCAILQNKTNLQISHRWSSLWIISGSSPSWIKSHFFLVQRLSQSPHMVIDRWQVSKRRNEAFGRCNCWWNQSGIGLFAEPVLGAILFGTIRHAWSRNTGRLCNESRIRCSRLSSRADRNVVHTWLSLIGDLWGPTLKAMYLL